MEKRFTVFVGGVEVNDHLLGKEEAEITVKLYRHEGYDDVALVEVDQAYLNLAQAIIESKGESK